MKRSLIIVLISVIALSGTEMSAQIGYNFWLTTEGAGVSISNSGRPVSPLLYYDDYYEYEPVGHHYYNHKHSKKAYKKYKKMKKAQRKYQKARREYFEEGFFHFGGRHHKHHHHHHDYDDDDDDDDDDD